MKLAHLSLGAALLLAACGGNRPADNAADQLENAAAQSDPAAAMVLDNEADAIRDNGMVVGNSTDPQGSIQNAMENAGAAQTSNIQ
jgi:hypothetical protein